MKTVRLGSLCSIQSGGTPSRKDGRFFGGEIPWAKIGDLEAKDGVVHKTEESLTEAGLTAIGGRVFPRGTVLLAMYGSVGKVAVAGAALTTNQAILGLQVSDPNVLSPEYLRRWLVHIRGKLAFAARGVTQQNISATLVRDLQIPLPPVTEQRRIAALLDTADAIGRKYETSLKLFDGLPSSIFVEMFGAVEADRPTKSLPSGWRPASVESIAVRAANSCAGGPFGSTLGRRDYVPNGVPVIRGNNLVAGRGGFRDEDFVFVTPAKAKELRRNVALPGDVIFTQRGTLGQVAQIPLSAKYDRYIISQSQMKVTLNPDVVDPTYLVHYFLSPRGASEIALRTVATGVPHINLSILKNFPVVLPPLPLQRRFATLVTQHARTRGHIARAYLDAERLAKSLAYSVFEGRVPQTA